MSRLLLAVLLLAMALPHGGVAGPDRSSASSDGADDEPRRKKPAVAFVPTPHDVVAKMLELAKVTKDDLLTDLGCGDGRIVIAAAKTSGCKAVGYDLDPACVKRSRAAAEKAGVGKLVLIEEADILEVDLSKFTVVTLFVGAKLNGDLVPQLEKMKAGSRVVSHFFPIPGVKPDRVWKVTSTDDGVERALYLYTIPMTKEKSERFHPLSWHGMGNPHSMGVK